MNAVAFTPDGRRLVSGSEDATLRVWDLGVPPEPSVQEKHAQAADRATPAPRGSRASSATGKTLVEWHIAKGLSLYGLVGHDSWVNSVAITPDGCTAVSVGGDIIKVWDLQDASVRRSWIVPGRRFNTVAITRDGRRALAGASNGSLTSWDLDTGEQMAALQLRSPWVNAVAITPDGGHAVCAGGKSVEIWDLDRGELAGLLDGHKNSVVAVAVTDRKSVV